MDTITSDEGWVRQPQEKEGTYMFSGRFLITNGVQELLRPIDIELIYLEVLELANTQGGLDYLQVFQRKTDGRKLFFIDQLPKEQIESEEFLDEANYCVLMLAEEY